MENNAVILPWDEFAFKYQVNKYSVIPLAPRDKMPRLPNWSQYCDMFMDAERVKSFYNNNHNIGLCLGKASKTFAIDVDSEDEAFIKKIRQIIPVSPVEKKGAKGFTAFYRYEGQPSHSYKDEHGNGIDILAHGRQTVLPPSIHPKGMAYVWLTKTTLLDIVPEKLPVVEEFRLKQIAELFKKAEKPINVRAPTKQDAARSKMDEVADALNYIDPSCGYEQWCEIGMAISSEFGDAGFYLWNAWSERSPKYPKAGSIELFKKFKSFKSTGITISSLFHYAICGGYKPNTGWGDPPEEESQEELKATQRVLAAFMGTPVDEEPQEDTDALMNPPGLLGQVYDWVVRSNPLYQPMYSLPTAMNIIALFYAHKLKTESDAHTNVYTIAVGPSGSGKTLAAGLINKFFSYMPNIYMKAMLGEPKSDAGLVDSLVSAGGKGLLMIDEIGHFLRLLKSSSASVYTASIGGEFTKFFSKAGDTYTSPAYSHNAKKSSIQIPNPCLIIYGQSVKERIFAELKRDDFIDGFFNRWLIFESETKIALNNTDYIPPKENPPVKLVEMLQSIDKVVTDKKFSTNKAASLTGGIHILTVPITASAKQMLSDYGKKINDRRVASDHGLMDYPMSRTFEHCNKLALLACEWSGDLEPVITSQSVEWAIAACEHNLRQIKAKMELMTESLYDEQVKKVLDRIPKGRRMSSHIFHKTLGWINPRERKVILEDLLTRGDFEWEVNGDKKYLVRK